MISVVSYMENNPISSGLGLPFSAARNSVQTTASPPTQAPAAAEQQGQVAASRELAETSRVNQSGATTDSNPNRPGGADQGIDPLARQQQIETFLAEQTGQDAATFRGIDIQSALELQENLRNRPTEPSQQEQAFSPAPGGEELSEPADANVRQDQELQQRLQNRLAEQIPTDPGTEFPQLIETIA